MTRNTDISLVVLQKILRHKLISEASNSRKVFFQFDNCEQKTMVKPWNYRIKRPREAVEAVNKVKKKSKQSFTFLQWIKTFLNSLYLRNKATIKMMSSLFPVKKWVRDQTPARIRTFFKLGRMVSDPKLDASFHSDDKKLSWRKFDKLGSKSDGEALKISDQKTAWRHINF